ncbi:DUF6542 domain-containing protein [Jatrophihabitans endophyticus]|uniref:DUF6542 domain-containing protein n=1 Tax=Jatrophihabitans endophyticus TaxID=1206085 RepID=UPI00116122A9|nr:DUF6542 domain-containing protein [Jatrophihabitans endophyticus]
MRGGTARKPARGEPSRGNRDGGHGTTPPADPRARASQRRPSDDWSPAGPASRDQQRANRAAERSVRDLEAQRNAAARPPERGLPAWAALVVLVVIAIAGGLIDTIGSIEVQGGFNIGIVAASVIAILVVKRSHMFPVVIAPPIVYTLGAAFQYTLRASGGNATKAKLDAAANYLVYGFPAIAAATAAVLIIAGIRMIIRK